MAEVPAQESEGPTLRRLLYGEVKIKPKLIDRVASLGYTSKAGRGSLLSSSVSAQDLRYLDMEKERKDVSSPRGVLEGCIRSLESEMDSSETNSSESETRPNSTAVSHWRGFVNLLKKRSIKRLPSFSPLMPKIQTRKSKSARENTHADMNPEDVDFCSFNSSWKNFTLSDLQTATNNFSHANLIGKGGYAEVYQGCLRDRQLVAIKRLTRGTPEERTAGFLSELGIIAHVNHPNTAKLIGYGIEGGLHLVIQLSPRGSLASVLHDSKKKLDWGIRYKIALGTADGLTYLHESCQRRIIHRDIKADNILLTEDYEPQICDFGLAKWLPKQWTHHNVPKFEGTFGYFAPEYFMHGIVDEKTDVFAFGVLLLELITGRRALEQQQSLVIWAKPLLDDNNIQELVDPSLGDAYDPDEIDRVVLTASLCIEHSPILRPRMSQVVILLRDEGCSSKCTKNCQRQPIKRTFSEEIFDAEEYNSTRYLSDLTRLRQVALGT